MFALKNSINVSSGFTPYYLAYGFKPHCFPDEYDRLAAFNHKDTLYLLDTIERNLAKAQDTLRKSQDQGWKWRNGPRWGLSRRKKKWGGIHTPRASESTHILLYPHGPVWHKTGYCSRPYSS